MKGNFKFLQLFRTYNKGIFQEIKKIENFSRKSFALNLLELAIVLCILFLIFFLFNIENGINQKDCKLNTDNRFSSRLKMIFVFGAFAIILFSTLMSPLFSLFFNKIYAILIPLILNIIYFVINYFYYESDTAKTNKSNYFLLNLAALSITLSFRNEKNLNYFKEKESGQFYYFGIKISSLEVQQAKIAEIFNCLNGEFSKNYSIIHATFFTIIGNILLKTTLGLIIFFLVDILVIKLITSIALFFYLLIIIYKNSYHHNEEKIDGNLACYEPPEYITSKQ
jgi:hypothetical protein